MSNNELQHYGIMGMKWGVRRYQNYDGSYTQAGMKRYNKSMENYESSREREKQTKADYKAGKATKDDVAKAKGERKAYKRQLNADYRQLALDKKADKGKRLYAEGRRITDDNLFQNVRHTVVGGAAAASAYLVKNGQADLGKKVGVAAVGAGIADGLWTLKEMRDANLLRAFYGHSRNPDMTAATSNTKIKGEAANAEWAASSREELVKAYGAELGMDIWKRLNRR